MNYDITDILSDGFAYGKIKYVAFNNEINEDNDICLKKEAFKNALKKSLEQINELKKTNNKLYNYLSFQELIFTDPLFIQEVNEKIDNNYSIKDSIDFVFNNFSLELAKSNSIYLKERTIDIEDALKRLIINLNASDIEKYDDQFIIYTKKLYPTYLINHKNNIKGVIVHEGGYTSHSAILCRQLNIPFVVLKKEINDAKTAIIDTVSKLIVSNPSKKEVEFYSKNTITTNEKCAVSHNGYLFLANISNNYEIENVIKYGFDGVGLYRTEMLFMNSNTMPSSEEQYKIYNEAYKMLEGRPICFRTFDIGDDKKLSYMKANKKGVENYYNNKVAFITQVNAILKINSDSLKIMFPMIESKEEFDTLKKWVCDLARDNNYKIPKIGMMLETKKCLDNIEDFINTDFISIGTNDLVSELYSINRDELISINDEEINELLKKLKKVVSFCGENNISLSVCGELASISRIAEAFYDIGIKDLSASPEAIRSLNIAFTNFMNKK